MTGFGFDPYESWGEDSWGGHEGSGEWGDHGDVEIESLLESMQGESYSRSFEQENPSPSSVRWNDDKLLKLLKGVGYGLLPNFLDELRDHANNESITKGAVYASAVHTEEDRHGTDFAPGGYVYTKNYEARLDEAYHATLLKVLDKSKAIIGNQQSGRSRSRSPAGGKRSIGKDGRTRYHGAGGRFVSKPQ